MRISWTNEEEGYLQGNFDYNGDGTWYITWDDWPATKFHKVTESMSDVLRDSIAEENVYSIYIETF